MSTGSLAWVEALDRRRRLQRAPRRKRVGRRSATFSSAAGATPAFVDGPDEDVHAFVERQLVERVGDLGKRLHTCQLRNEQVSLDLRLYLRTRRLTSCSVGWQR